MREAKTTAESPYTILKIISYNGNGKITENETSQLLEEAKNMTETTDEFKKWVNDMEDVRKSIESRF